VRLLALLLKVLIELARPPQFHEQSRNAFAHGQEVRFLEFHNRLSLAEGCRFLPTNDGLLNAVVGDAVVELVEQAIALGLRPS
jgi:hypothetical protein